MEESIVVYDEVRPRLAKLKVLTEELNQASDAFSGELKRIEDDLAEMNIGLEVEVPYPFDMGDTVVQHPLEGGRQVVTTRHLGYRKIDRRGWRIVVNEYLVYNPNGPGENEPHEGGPETILQGTKPLVDETREVRLAASGDVDQLLTTLIAAANLKIKDLKKVSTKNDA